RLTGIVSAYDLQAKMEEIETVAEIMVPADTVLDLSATAKDALIAIDQAKFGIVPVVGAEGRVAGVVTKGSLLTMFSRLWVQNGQNGGETPS
ncbi:MAG TPA: CBS domain-containing protein, partial [Paenibacillaceae bacterium]